jgi:5-methyltetrahydrofolate--homocysteine methyltransferase
MAIKNIVDCVLAFDEAGTVQGVQDELNGGTDALGILNDGLIAAMDEVGSRYSQGVFFVPEMLMAAQAMKAGVSVLRPHLQDAASSPKGSIVIGTVRGDRHDIGKNLVAMMLECAGYKVVDLGVDVEAERFVDAARQNGADLVALSALITTTLASMQSIVTRIKSERDAPKTLVGGAPVTQEFADRIGADAYSPDAVGAVTAVRQLLGDRDADRAG